MASTDATPVPKKNVAYRVTLPVVDTNGVLITTGLSTLASQISKDGGAMAAAGTPVEIATNSGFVYLDLTAANMNADTVAGKITSTEGIDIPFVLYPEEGGDIRVNVTQMNGDGINSGAVATDGGNTATTFKTNLTEAVSDFWKDAFIKFTSGSLSEQVKKITAYNGTTKFITVSGGFTGTPSASDTFDIINR
jgi:hypothetical protein